MRRINALFCGLLVTGMAFGLIGAAPIDVPPESTALEPLVQAAPEEAPQQALEAFLTTLRSMDFPVKDPVRQQELFMQANAYLDLDRMVKKALGEHWAGAPLEEQQEFLRLMWRLIEEVAYAAGHEFLGSYEITFPEVTPVEDGFVVRSLVEQSQQEFNAEVIYYLESREGSWSIYDIILDGVSIIEDLQYQFDKIIADSAFPGLLDRMRTRLAEAEAKNLGPSE